MARRLLGIGAFLLSISIFSVFMVVAIYWLERIVQYVNNHGWNTFTDFFIWPLRDSNFSYPELIFAGWIAFSLGFGFILFHGFVSFIRRFFRKSILMTVPENPDYRTEGVKLVAVIPAFDEAQSIGEVIVETRKYVDDIVVVNDGSNDETADIAFDLGTNLVNHDRQRGLGITMRNGLNAALELGADVIVTLDADGQYLPEEIPNVIYPITSGKADLVLGSRSAGTIEKMPLTKRFGNRMMTFVVGMFTNIRLTDTQTGFRAMTSGVAKALNLKGKYTYTQEMVLQTARNGYRVVDVPINFRKRSHGASRLIATSTDYAFRTIAIVLRTIRDENPLGFFGSGGLLLMASGGYVIGEAAIQWAQKAPVSTSSVILGFLFVSVGLQILLFGFVADMLRKEKSRNVNETITAAQITPQIQKKNEKSKQDERSVYR